jgi:hypothetical protein
MPAATPTGEAAQHTPGPWVLNERDRAATIPVRGPHNVCSAYGGTLANARLIAAAPDLLEALITLRAATPGTATQKAARARADAAVAKATS